MSKIQIDEVAKQTLLMSIDGEPKCEFVFDGDEVQVTDPNGEIFKNELVAERYLRLLFETVDIDIVVSDDEDYKASLIQDEQRYENQHKQNMNLTLKELNDLYYILSRVKYGRTEGDIKVISLIDEKEIDALINKIGYEIERLTK